MPPRPPTPGDYQEALQFPDAAFADPALQAAVPDTNALGLPVAITGAFAAVFPVSGPGGRWAVKCFLQESRGQQARYKAIAEHLRERPLPYTVGFDYQQHGIRVQGQWWPILRMEWIGAVPLNRHIADHLHDAARLRGLAEAWLRMLDALEEAEVAHGDLQHGNVLVRPDGRLILVDYDTMVVPALRGRPSAEVGHRNYQHPDRSEHDAGLYLDRFPGLAIYVALRALAERPALWERYDTGENILFRAGDFYDPAASPLFAELAETPGVKPLAQSLRTACLLEPEQVPPVREVVGSGLKTRPARRRRASNGEPERRTAAEARWVWALVAGWVVAAGLGLLAGWMVAAVLAAGVGVAAGIGAWRMYRSLPVVRRRRRLARERVYFDRILRELRRQLADVEGQRQAHAGADEARRAERLAELRAGALYDRLKHHFIGEVAAVDGLSHKVVVRLKAAGIRTAHQATADRINPLRDLSGRTKARVLTWRAALVNRYADALPDRLSPAEERRLERQLQARVEALEDEAARIREKTQVQAEERQQVEARGAALPPITFGRYLGHLLHVRALPARAIRPPRPSAPAPVREPRPPADAEVDAVWWQ